MRLVDVGHWHLRHVRGVLKFEVKLLGHVDGQHLELSLSEGLSEAHSTSSVERHPTAVVTLLAVGSLAQLAGRIEALGDDFSGTLPLVWVVAKASKVDVETVSLLEVVLAKL